MTRTLYIHIGHYKTGTSAVQAFMTVNTEALAQLGLTYLDWHMELAKHSALPFALYHAAGVNTLMHGYNNPVRPEQLWDELIERVASAPTPVTVISSEEFIRLGAHPRAVEILRDLAARPRNDIDIRIVAWLRAPDAHLRSWYNQLVKMKVALPDFNTAVRRVMEPVHYDYAMALRPWIDIFGAEAVQVRPYHGGLRQGHAMYEDFLAALGVERPGEFDDWWIPEDDLNPRLDDRLLDLIRVMQAQGMEDQDITWACNRARKRFDTEMQHADAEDPPFEQIAGVCASGLDYLATLPGNQVDVSLFQQNMPHPNDPLQGELTQVMGQLIDDMQKLRDRVHHRIAGLIERIEALEKRNGPE